MRSITWYTILAATLGGTVDGVSPGVLGMAGEVGEMGAGIAGAIGAHLATKTCPGPAEGMLTGEGGGKDIGTNPLVAPAAGVIGKAGGGVGAGANPGNGGSVAGPPFTGDEGSGGASGPVGGVAAGLCPGGVATIAM